MALIENPFVFTIEGNPIPKPRMVSTSKFWSKPYKRYWDYVNSAAEIISYRAFSLGVPQPVKDDIRCNMVFYRKGEKRADADNCQKTVFEILQKAKIIENDNQITEGEFRMRYNSETPQTTILIKELYNGL